ncbi:MAG: phosphoribosyltransferase family protein [Oscillospiraceae bacterium]
MYQIAAGADVEGKRILLVDDVITTGSTLSECARILRTAGAAEVCCVTLARAGGR